MSTQEVTDYLTKQLFIERDIVTYRSLSRQFSIHVNTAKNELATFSHNTFYQAQNCSVTYLLSGTIRRRLQVAETDDDDVDMDCDLYATQEAGEEDDDGEEVPQTKITIVNEKELEDAKALYDTVGSVHVYSLSPAPVHDAGLICAPAEDIRKADKTGGPKLAATVGRVVCTNIKMKEYKKGKQPAAPVAGPSKLKQSENKFIEKPPAPEPASKAQPAPPVEKAKEKAKPAGKMGFFMTKPKDEKPKEEKPPVVVKKEPANAKNMMFFHKGPSRSPSVASDHIEPEKPSRGVKRKSSMGLEKARAKTPEVVKVKKRVILSDDDESDADIAPKQSRRQAQISKAEKMENDAAQREALALMDIDDDQVEKVSRSTSSNINLEQEGEGEEEKDTKVSIKAGAQQDEDIDMVDETTSKPAPRKKSQRKVVPIGGNGLKKRKVMKTRRTTDENGYMRTEDYSDWESVDENADPEPARPKGKTKPALVKKDADDHLDDPAPAPAQPETKKAATKAPGTKTKGKSTAGGKPQKGLLNFFGPPKK